MRKSNSDHNTNELLVFTFKNRRALILTGVIAGVISVVVSLFLPVLYESNAIVFPTATSTVSFNPQVSLKAGSMDFGEEENAEQLIQILESGPMRNRVIQEFDLGKVYDIQPTASNYYYKLKKKYEERISFRRTRYGSINISVLDREPERAAEITNTIVSLIDTLMNELIKERTVPAFEINKRKLNQLKSELDGLNNELDSLSNLGVVDSKARASLIEVLNEAKSSADKDMIRNQIDINQKLGIRYDALVELREFRAKKMTELEVSYDQAESDATETINHKFVVEQGYAADKKAKPKRAIVVLVSTLAAVVLMFIALLIRDRMREIKLAE